MHVFVYGTLKKSQPNHHWLTTPENGHAKYVCRGKTSQLYPLVIASKYNIPFLLDHPGTGKNIQGEVYEIDEKMLSNLDILEEYPKLYTRREEEIIPILDNTGENGHANGENANGTLPTVIKAWGYFLSNFQQDLLSKPFLDCYSSDGPMQLPYIARYLRDQAVDHRFQVKHSVP